MHLVHSSLREVILLS